MKNRWLCASRLLGLVFLFSACLSPLQKAAQKGDTEKVQALLAKGTKIDETSREGMTPLMWAAYFNQEATVRLLLEKGANVNAVDQRGRSAAWYAATVGNLDALKALRQHGADVTAVDKLGKTISAAAQEAGRIYVVQYLTMDQNDLQSRLELQNVVNQALGRPAPASAKTSDVDAPKFQQPARPDDFALIVGVEKYKAVPDADYAVRDAEAVRKHVQALGIPKQNTIYLVGPNATRASLASYLEEWLPSNIKPDSNLVFYFSGHGAPDVEGGETYLVPWDGDPAFLKSSAYSTRRLYEQLAKIKAKSTLIVVDACFSGGGRSVLPKGARPLLVTVQSGLVPSHMILFSAAGPNQIAGALEDQGHGLFTYYFLKGLDTAAREANGNLTVDGLYWYLKPLVEEGARRQNRTQTPILEGTPQDQVIMTSATVKP